MASIDHGSDAARTPASRRGTRCPSHIWSTDKKTSTIDPKAIAQTCTLMTTGAKALATRPAWRTVNA